MTTSTTPAIKFVNIEQHMNSEQAGINAQLLAEGYSRQHIVLAFIAGCYGVAINHVRLLGCTQYVVRGLDAQCALPVNIVRYLTPVVHKAVPAVAKVETRTPEQTAEAIERARVQAVKDQMLSIVAADAASKGKRTRRPAAGKPVVVTEVPNTQA